MWQLVYTMFISNNYASFHLWGKENFVKHQRVSKYFHHDFKLLSEAQPSAQWGLNRESSDSYKLLNPLYQALPILAMFSLRSVVILPFVLDVIMYLIYGSIFNLLLTWIFALKTMKWVKRWLVSFITGKTEKLTSVFFTVIIC